MQIYMCARAQGISNYNTRLEQENSKTQKLLKKELDKNVSLSSQIQELKLNNEAMKKELMIIRRNIGTDGINFEAMDELRLIIKKQQEDLDKNVFFTKILIM
jgi:hypothetical protein